MARLASSPARPQSMTQRAAFGPAVLAGVRTFRRPTQPPDRLGASAGAVLHSLPLVGRYRVSSSVVKRCSAWTCSAYPVVRVVRECRAGPQGATLAFSSGSCKHWRRAVAWPKSTQMRTRARPNRAACPAALRGATFTDRHARRSDRFARRPNVRVRDGDPHKGRRRPRQERSESGPERDSHRQQIFRPGLRGHPRPARVRSTRSVRCESKGRSRLFHSRGFEAVRSLLIRR
jgi:hypothetical protein